MFEKSHANLHKLVEQGKTDEAISAFKALLKNSPNDPKALFGIGYAYFKALDYDEASKYLNAVLQSNDNTLYFDCHMTIAVIAVNNKEYERAKNYYEKALSIKPKHTLCLNHLGIVYQELKQVAKAIALFNKAIALDTTFIAAHINLAMSYQSIGQFDEAKKRFRDVLNINESIWPCHLYLANIHQYHEKDPHLAQMARLMEDAPHTDNKTIYLSFALAKAYDEIKQYKNVFPLLKSANDCRRQQLSYDIQIDTNLFKQLKKTFNAEFMSRFANTGADDKAPTFIVGLPRSGTTLVEQILSSHPLVASGGECYHLDELMSSYFIRHWQKDIYPEHSGAVFREIGLKYLAMLKANNIRKTDKMPLNFRWLGLIKLILPKAKIIHCVRNESDNAFSIYKTFFSSPGNGYAYNLTEMAQFFILYQDIMAHWDTLLGKSIYHIKLDDLVLFPKETTRALLDNCKLPFHQNCLQFYNNDNIVNTASLYHVRQKLSKSHLGNSQPYLNELIEFSDAIQRYRQK